MCNEKENEFRPSKTYKAYATHMSIHNLLHNETETTETSPQHLFFYY